MTGSLGLLSAFAESLGSSVNIAMALFTRLSLLMLLLPGLSGSVIPVRIRLILALTLLAMILPLVDVPEITDARLPAVLITEAAIGLSLGLTVRMLFFALSISGAIIAQALSLSQIFGTSMDGDSSSTISNALVMAGSALFLTADFEVAAIGMFVDNLTAVPVGAPGLFASGQTAEFLTRLASEAIAFGVMLALPFLVLNFAYYLVLGFLNRAMPQLMVTFVGLPAVTLGGLTLLTMTVVSILTVWLARVSGVIS